MLTDPIAGFLTHLRNASSARRGSLSTTSSRMIKSIAQVLKNKHFIEDFEEKTEGSHLELSITLRVDREPLRVKRVSKPGQRIYLGVDNIRRVRNGLGVGIISTSHGIINDDEARKLKVGGEYICEIY